MSENQNRGIRDFSKYDSMETSELEQILRLDAEAPEGTESDTELILYVMEVLASRRNNTNITGNTAQQSWESFQKNYMPHNVRDFKPRREHKPVAPWVRHLIATAAVLALIIAIPVTANAFSWRQLWNTVATWAKETFSFISSEDNNDHTSTSGSTSEYSSLYELLEQNDQATNIVPIWIPERFNLAKIEQDISPLQGVYRAFYLCGDEELMIRIQSYLDRNPGNIEINEDLIEIYAVDGQDYYFFLNNNQLQAIWVMDSYECQITGDLSIDELKHMIDSIGKG